MNESRQKEFFINSERREYVDGYDRLNWVSAGQAQAASEERQELLLWLENRGAGPKVTVLGSHTGMHLGKYFRTRKRTS